MEFSGVDAVSVVLAAFLYMVVNMFWYSKWLFGPVWLKYSKLPVSDSKTNKMSLVWASLNALVIAYFLAFFEGYLGITTVSDGMFVALCFWLGFVATTQIGACIWFKEPIQLFAINTGAKLASYLVMGGILGA